MNLATEFRPKTLDEVIGNEPIKKVLSGQFASQKLPHAYLLHGRFGTGKTTIARIIGSYLDADITEHDCGADSAIEEIRKIVNDAQYSALFSDKKVIILDEVHKLSKPAQDVLLKTVEEPGEDVYFILCTSEPSKLTPALRSRCVELEVKPVEPYGIRAAVDRVMQEYNLEVENMKDFYAVVEQSEGSLRKVYNILEKLLGAAESNGNKLYVSSKTFKEVVGSKDEAEIDENLPKQFMQGDLKNMFAELEKIRRKENPYSTYLGVYNYMKKVWLSTGPTASKVALLSLMAETLQNKELDWLAVEHLLYQRYLAGNLK